MTKNKRDKIVKIIGVIVLIYLSFDIGVRTIYLISSGFDFSNPFLPDSMKIHIYIATILKFVILLSLILWVIYGLRKRKWISFPIAILIVIVAPKYISYLPYITHSIAVTNQEDIEKASLEDIIQQQDKVLDLSKRDIRLKKVYLFNCKNGKPKKKGNLSSTCEYDDNGNIIRKNGKVFHYDTLNQLVKEIKPNINGDIDTIIYSYNNDNLQVEKKYIANKYVRTTKYEYDKNLNKVNQISFMDGVMNYQITNFYDDSTRLIKSVSKDYEENYTSKDLYKYSGNKKIEYNFSSIGDLYTEIHFSYDSLGREVEQKVINFNPKTIHENYFTYDNNGNKIKYELISEGKTRGLEVWEYDDNNNLISLADYNGTIKYQYQLNMRIKEEFYAQETGNLEWIKLYVYN